MARTFWLIAAILGFLGVALGAFGAHALKGRLTEGALAAYQTGIQYHLLHALALLLCATLMTRVNHSGLVAAGWFFAAGVVLFSGSLYALAVTGVRALGAITPLGGLAFLVGWACLAWAGAAQR